ncbi:MAG: hypothetical protein LBT43_19640 [Prevotella sp.]|jgi:protein-arginine kinase activator protein McsA|nr:hypothetical protein [Prevotella sp.]
MNNRNTPEETTNVYLYENFITRAYKKGNNNENGAHASFMMNLIREEKGFHVATLPDITEQLISIKKYISDAIDVFLKKDVTDTEYESLIILKDKVKAAKNSSDLIQIINEGLEITDRFKIE